MSKAARAARHSHGHKDRDDLPTIFLSVFSVLSVVQSFP
jgi:hypothetical protein